MRRYLTLAAAALSACALAPPSAWANAPERVPLPWAIVHRAECPDGGGSCAYPSSHEVYLAPGAGRFALFHELGHVYLDNLDGFWKGTIATHVSRGGWQWTDRTAERAADAYAACALRLQPMRRRGNHVSGNWATAYDYQPTRRQHRRVCSAIRRSATQAQPNTAQ